MHGLRPFRRIEEGALDLPGYRRLLAGIQHFHFAAHATFRRNALSSHGSEERRLPLLAQDMAHLGTPPSPAFHAAQETSREAALGWLYVAEGSMLGGKIIARQLDYLFGNGSNGRRFFLGLPEDGLAWTMLNRHLAALAPKEDEIELMIAGAERSFAYFEACLGEAGCL